MEESIKEDFEWANSVVKQLSKGVMFSNDVIIQLMMYKQLKRIADRLQTMR